MPALSWQSHIRRVPVIRGIKREHAMNGDITKKPKLHQGVKNDTDRLYHITRLIHGNASRDT